MLHYRVWKDFPTLWIYNSLMLPWQNPSSCLSSCLVSIWNHFKQTELINISQENLVKPLISCMISNCIHLFILMHLLIGSFVKIPLILNTFSGPPKTNLYPIFSFNTYFYILWCLEISVFSCIHNFKITTVSYLFFSSQRNLTVDYFKIFDVWRNWWICQLRNSH